jgi:hypothetical protein
MVSLGCITVIQRLANQKAKEEELKEKEKRLEKLKGLVCYIDIYM